MQVADREGFEEVFKLLCAAYDTPPTDQRKGAYWLAFQSLSLSQFRNLVQGIMRSGTVETMPTVGQMWAFRRAQEPAQAKASGHVATIQERLCAHASKHLHGKLDPHEFTRPWTYLYASDGRCTGVRIDRDGGHPPIIFRTEVLEERDFGETTAELDLR